MIESYIKDIHDQQVNEQNKMSVGNRKGFARRCSGVSSIPKYSYIYIYRGGGVKIIVNKIKVVFSTSSSCCE